MPKEPIEVIDQLSPTDGLVILRNLAASDELLAQRIAQMAMDYLGDIDPEEVAFTLQDELEFLQVEDVWDRAGRTRHGYVEPGKVAYEMIDEVLEPFLQELAKYQKLEMPVEARRLCMGLLAGLYLFERESSTEFQDWAPDAPTVFAKAVVDAWKDGSPGQADIAAVRAFVEQELERWGSGLV